MITLKELVAVTLVALLFGGVSSMDREDEANRIARYCEQVEAKVHPAYNDNISCDTPFKTEGK